MKILTENGNALLTPRGKVIKTYGVIPAGNKEITNKNQVDVANYATAQVVDADLIPGNIRKDIDILGVVGTYDSGIPEPTKGFVPIAWNSDGYVTKGKIVGMTEIPNSFLNTQNGQQDFYLSELVLPSNLTSIGNESFRNHYHLQLVSLPNSITSIGEYAFGDCGNLTLVSLPNSLTKINYGTFYGCKNLALTSLPDSITTIETNGFYQCKNLSLTSLPNGIIGIYTNAFYDCQNLALTSLPNNLTIIYQTSFYRCINLALTSLPENIITIQAAAFGECSKLALEELPNTITTIEGNAFYNCTNLTNLRFKGTPTSIASNTFNGCTNLTDIFVPWAKYAVQNEPWGAEYATIWHNFIGYAVKGDFVSPTIIYNNTYSQTLKYYMFDDIADSLEVTATSSNQSVTVVPYKDTANKKVIVTVAAGNQDAVSNIEVTFTFKKNSAVVGTVTKSFVCTVVEEIPIITEVQSVEGATYGFTLNSDNYYESQNKGVHSSYALCRIKVSGLDKIYLDCINSGESNYDFGLISKLDTPLSLSNNADTDVFKSFKGESSYDVQTIEYPIVDTYEHYIYIKFRKDGSTSSGNDSLQFKIRLS